MRKMTSQLLFVMLLTLAAMPFAVPAARADDGDSAAILQQLKELKAMVRDIDTRIQRLEQRQHAAVPAAAPALSQRERAAVKQQAHAASAKENWRGIKNGLSQEDVSRLLGKPQRTFLLSGKRVWYYYYPGVGGGSIFFNSEGKIIGSQSPPFGAFGLF